MLAPVSAPAQASEVAVNLSGRKTVAWSFSTMFDYTAEGVALTLVVVEVASGACTTAGCICKPDMTSANLASESKW